MRNSYKEQKITVSANAESVLFITGTFFEILAANGPVKVAFDNDAETAMEAGILFDGEEFKQVKIINENSADLTLRIAYGRGTMRDNRMIIPDDGINVHMVEQMVVTATQPLPVDFGENKMSLDFPDQITVTATQPLPVDFGENKISVDFPDQMVVTATQPLPVSLQNDGGNMQVQTVVASTISPSPTITIEPGASATVDANAARQSITLRVFELEGDGQIWVGGGAENGLPMLIGDTLTIDAQGSFVLHNATQNAAKVSILEVIV